MTRVTRRGRRQKRAVTGMNRDWATPSCTTRSMTRVMRKGRRQKRAVTGMNRD